jgi:tRNA threonylcarbamoyladenosine biosynthesis protein TsaE
MHTSSLQETYKIAEDFFTTLKPNDLVALTGDLGSGKTAFVKGMLSSMMPEEEIQSPTYVYLNTYSSCQPVVYHFDLYRLKSSSEFLALGFDEFLHTDGITLLEWADRILPILPSKTHFVHLEATGKETRTIHIKRGNGTSS